MQRVSTNLTLFLKLFFPTFWAVFFGMFTLFALFYQQSEILLLQHWGFKLSVLSLYLFFFTFFYFTLFQLKRVEMGIDCYHVSDYFSTYRMVYEDIDRVREIPVLRWILVIITLQGKSRFGRKIMFLANKNLYLTFLLEHENVQMAWKSLQSKE
jgi:hypothetical protein